MRQIVYDLYLTVVVPLLAVAVVSLWNAIRLWREARWRGDQVRPLAKKLVVLSGSAVALLFGCLFLSDSAKVVIAENVFWLISFVSTISFVGAAVCAWQYASQRKWLPFLICLAVLLMAAASAEHCFHQVENARHALCPHCVDTETND